MYTKRVNKIKESTINHDSEAMKQNWCSKSSNVA